MPATLRVTRSAAAASRWLTPPSTSWNCKPRSVGGWTPAPTSFDTMMSELRREHAKPASASAAARIFSAPSPRRRRFDTQSVTQSRTMRSTRSPRLRHAAVTSYGSSTVGQFLGRSAWWRAMRRAISPSPAWAVARKPVRAPQGDTAARRRASRLLPLRTPPRMKSDWWRLDWSAGLTQVLPRRPVGVQAPGQVSWLSDRPTPRAFPARCALDQWLHAGFVPDYSDGVAADSHRLPWDPLPAGRPNTNDAV